MTSYQQVIAAMEQAFVHKKGGPLAQLMADDIELRPPTYGGSWSGKDLVERLVNHASQTFSDFTYTSCTSENSTIILRFETQVGEKHLSGVDIVQLNDSGEISLIEIFSRPPKAAQHMLEMMTNRIVQDPETADLMKRD